MSKIDMDEAVTLIIRGQLEDFEFFDIHETLEYHYDTELTEQEVCEVFEAVERVAKQLIQSVTGTDVTYKTVIPGRYPEEKIHAKIGPAKSAISYTCWGPGVRGGKLYELKHGNWNLLYDVAPRTAHGDLPWHKK